MATIDDLQAAMNELRQERQRLRAAMQHGADTGQRSQMRLIFDDGYVSALSYALSVLERVSAEARELQPPTEAEVVQTIMDAERRSVSPDGW